MVLKNLILKDFRNIVAATVAPEPVFNIFWGENAQGKTNILEAIYLLGTLKSFRAAHNEDLVRKGTSQALVRAETESEGITRYLQVGIDPQGKRPLLNGKRVIRPENFFRALRPILFAPEEVALVKGPPAGRRALIDRAIFQTDPYFLATAREYDRILRQRNRLLREQRPDAEILPWTTGLIRTGALIRKERYHFLQRLLPLFRRTYEQICGGREVADLIYREGRPEIENLQDDLVGALESQAEVERRAGTTLAGPHRDDPYFTVDGLPVRQFASQGQQRSFLLAFKTAQIMDLENIFGEPPILLLDDLTGELDRRRQEFFFHFLLNRRGQVFMTTTDLRPLQNDGFSQARTFQVRAGALDPA
jgi:DNA replication and repair protein RecF